MPVQKKGNGWRARRKKGSKTFAGPVRATEAAANEDAQLFDTATAVSMERLEEAHDRLTGVLPGAGAGNDCGDKFVEKSRNGWRARRKIGVPWAWPQYRGGCKGRCAAIGRGGKGIT